MSLKAGASGNDGFQPGLALSILVSPSNKCHLLLQKLVSCLTSPLRCELTRTEELMAFFPLRYLLSSKKRLGYIGWLYSA